MSEPSVIMIDLLRSVRTKNSRSPMQLHLASEGISGLESQVPYRLQIVII
jgi:hypothetical protein